MLDRAAAANAEMRTEGGNAIRACGQNAQEMPPVRMTRNRLRFDDLAGQRVGRIDRTVRRVANAVAAMAEPGDGEMLCHAVVFLV